MTGFFISIEGGEGAGKSTQIRHMESALRSAGYNVLLTREPGGTPEAEKIRNLLVHRDGGNWSPLEECLLLFTARSSHIRHGIQPALAAGKVVISDRFSDSTYAYQGYGHGLPLDVIKKIEEISIGNFKPDLTIILDIPVTEGLARSKARLKNESSAEDRFERIDVQFHERLRQGFLSMAAEDKKRCHVVDARKSETEIADTVSAIVLERMKV